MMLLSKNVKQVPCNQVSEQAMIDLTFFKKQLLIIYKFTQAREAKVLSRAVIKSQGPGISCGYYECGPQLLS